MTYTPDITRYQQLVYGGATGPFDCTAWAGALVADAHTKGGTKLSGRAIRLASSEPVPDPASPGLNDDQVDGAIYRLTSGHVNLETRHDLSRAQIKARVIDGRYVSLAVKRGVLVDRGYVTGFRGLHRLTVHARDIDYAPVMGDPLVARYIPTTWDAVFDACEATTPSGIRLAQFSRDLTPDYRATVHPPKGYRSTTFFRYFVKEGRITSRSGGGDDGTRTSGFSALCTPPKVHYGAYTANIVQLTTGSRSGWWIDAKWSKEIIP